SAFRRVGLDVTEHSIDGLNVVDVLISNFDYYTLQFEVNYAFLDMILYSFFLLAALFYFVFYFIPRGRYTGGQRVFLNFSVFSVTAFLYVLLRYSPPIGVLWEWVYNRPVPLPLIGRTVYASLAFALCFPLVKRIQMKRERDAKIIPFCLAVMAIIIMLAVTNIEYPVLEYLVRAVNSNSATGFFYQTKHIVDFESLLREYDQMRPSFTFHADGSPPGYLYIFYKIRRISAIPNQQLIMGSLFYVVLGGLSVVPVYYFARRVYNDEVAGYASIFYALSTSFVNFVPSHDQVNTLLVFIFLYYAYGGMIRRDVKEAVVAGILFAVVTLFSFSPLMLIVFILCWPLMRVKKKKDFTHTISLFIVFCGAFAAVHMIIYMVFGLNMMETFTTLLGMHKVVLSSTRTYWKWLILQPILFFIYAGLPTSLLFFKRILTRLSDVNLNETTNPFIIMFILLVSSGIIGGEVARMWMYLVPFVCMTAAKEVMAIKPKRTVYLIIVLLFMQIIMFKVCTTSIYQPYYSVIPVSLIT
ncbi:MAG: glycosyltransferase family 39 protein, partial [Candidatus Altiarchaeota archaeon]